MDYYQKYLKYKSKYIDLKKGGACNPPPNPTDYEYISLDEYQHIPAARLETIGGNCYDIIELANWIRIAANPIYPATNLPISINDIWNVITAYNAYRFVNEPALPNHFIYTPAQSAQIIAALANPPVSFVTLNLINNIRRPHAALPPVLPEFIAPTPAQLILIKAIRRVFPNDLVPGTIYIRYYRPNDRYIRGDPYMNVDAATGLLRFGNELIDPYLYRFANVADFIANGLPLPR